MALSGVLARNAILVQLATLIPWNSRAFWMGRADRAAAVAKQRPDLILMDIELPVMDGYEATRRIKAGPALPSIPVIAVTSYALSGEEKKALAAGCDECVPKPFSPRQLVAKIRNFLQ